MDNAATTRPYDEALETFMQVNKAYYFNTASIHQEGRKANQLLEASRKQMLDLLELKNYECVFTSGSTESNNIAIQSVLKKKKQFGRTVLVSELEHPSVVNVVEASREEGFDVKYIKTTARGQVDLNSLKELLNNDVIFVTVMAVNNITGAVQPVSEIAELIKDYPKVHFHVDATQAAGKVKMDFNGVDTLSMSAHKFHGLKGAGVLIVKQIEVVDPVYYGGGHEFNVRSGTVNLGAIAAMAKALRIGTQNLDENYNRISGFNESVKNTVKDLPSVHLQPGGVPHIVNLAFEGAQGEVVVNALSSRDIMVSTTSACASKLATLNETLMAMNTKVSVVKGSIRISFSNFTTKEEVDILVDALNRVHKEIGGVLK
ncbi:cysteine desulfurase family protein [Salinicoccus sp. HZC-1]|uniref:cysteine desulfurase family protein n=1 Tax=Salinicoccus sp. HZC-1 TaxID=3385497 RepID=UPI00398A92B1